MTKFADLPVRQVLNSEVISPTIVLHRLWHSCAAFATALAARLVQLVISPAYAGHVRQLQQLE